MSVLVFIDHSEGQIKKTSLEALSYGAALGKQMAVPAEGVLLGNVKEDLLSLGKYGIQKIHQLNHDSLNQLDTEQYIRIISTIAESSGSSVIVLSHTNTGRAIAPGLSVRLKAGLVTGATELPDTSNGFSVKKNVFSGKAFCTVSIKTPVKIISLNPNVFPVTTGTGSCRNYSGEYNIECNGRLDKIDIQGIGRDSTDRGGNCGQRRQRNERA